MNVSTEVSYFTIDRKVNYIDEMYIAIVMQVHYVNIWYCLALLWWHFEES